MQAYTQKLTETDVEVPEWSYCTAVGIWVYTRLAVGTEKFPTFWAERSPH
jgi:hypothetical protein